LLLSKKAGENPGSGKVFEKKACFSALDLLEYYCYFTGRRRLAGPQKEVQTHGKVRHLRKRRDFRHQGFPFPQEVQPDVEAQRKARESDR
jgi:hypothetical protein